MSENTPLVTFGYDIDEVDEIAREILDPILDIGVPNNLLLLGLVRALTILGDDIDVAHKLLEELNAIPYEEDEDDFELEEDDSDTDKESDGVDYTCEEEQADQ